MADTVKDRLRTLVYFEVLDDAALDWLAGQMVRRTFVPGETIFIEGEPAAGLWLVERGRVKIYKLNPDGGEHALHILGEGNTFNDIAALDGGVNPANAASLSDVTVWLLPSDVLAEAIERYSALALKVIRALAARVRYLVGQIEDLALYSVVVRLARFLLKQSEDPALSGPGVTRVAIAAHLATTPQTISNVLRALEDTGAIRFDRHRILIEREDILRSIAML
ncbi:MAG: Crp/Fnr family transcriptional regulator [Chloroflexi bacterium]|nr:Crp/Fnr family transcriptional regulator [Chloroflexota bacterium]